MAFTPLIRKLNQNGTTFYTFSSAARDLSKCMANTQKEFVFSHFVCINIPDFINPNNYDHSSQTTPNGSGYRHDPIDRNYTQLGGVNGLVDRDSNDPSRQPTTTSMELAESLQDYVFNFEELLIDESDDLETDRSVAERVFWHWLNETGAIQWKYDVSKIAPLLVSKNKYRYVEEDAESGYNYEKVVKYIGSIDITNNVDIANDAYTEIYVHIPSEHGNTPTVLFEQVFDGNYNSGATYQYHSSQDKTYIIGQNGLESHPDDLSIEALYDNMGNHTYSTGNELNGSVSSFDATYGNDDFGVNPKKSDLDGVCIDFDANSYREIVMGNIVNIDEFNKTGNTFEFNAVLVYYDIVDVSSGERTSNLYGILFLDDVKSDSWDYIQRYPKYKPTPGVSNGNSYGFKLNLRIDIEPDKTGITGIVNEYNTFSMSLFADAIARMQDCTEMFTRTRNYLNNIEHRLSDLENVMAMVTNYEVLAAKLEEMENALENANLAFADRSSLLDLIAHVSDNVDSIMSGRASVALQYNTDVIRNGYNTVVDNSTPNMVVINSATSGYSIMKPSIKTNGVEITETNPITLDDHDRTDNDIYTVLKPMTNMLRIYVEETIKSEYDINIFVDQSLCNWRIGQNIRIVFPNLTKEILNEKNIVLITGNNYEAKEVVNSNELGDKPIIEFTCVDNTLTSQNPFVHDVLR